MVTKSALIAGLVSGALGLPVALPYAAGAEVAVSFGPVELEISRRNGIDVDVRADCLSASCPLAVLRIGEADIPSYRAAI